jgi:diacylglycerol kinase family enzyme
MNAFAESGRSYYHRPSVRPLQLVVNPVSGNGRGVAVARGLERRLRAEGYDARTRVFEDSTEARVWVEDTRERLDSLICVGGDSTLSEFAPVAVRLGARFLPVPTGFGNIFARAFGHRADPDFVLRLLRGGRVLHADVGQEDKGGGLFLSSRSFGFLEAIKLGVEERMPPKSGLLRYLTYVRAAVDLVRTAPPPAIEVTVDGTRVSNDAVMAIVANVPTYRGYLPLTPHASAFDGLLDVLLVPRQSNLATVGVLMGFLLHHPGRWRQVQRLRGTQVSVTASGDPADVLRVLPSALPVLAPGPDGR